MLSLKADKPNEKIKDSVPNNGSSETAHHESPLFRIANIAGKGKGLIAQKDITKGTRILCEKPLFSATRPVSKPPADLEIMFASKLKALSKASQRQFLSLPNNFPGKYPFSNIFKTNALSCGPDSIVGAVYPSICLINHSCVPNSHNNWNDKAKHETIYAHRLIKAGEEITISYVSEGTSDVRHSSLKKAFGFDCSCDLCTRSPSEIKASDARRVKIQKLDDAIGDPIRLMNSPGKSLGMCRSLLQLLEKEYDGCAVVLAARLYYDAFQVCVAHGDRARAAVCAERAYQSRVVCEGEDSPATLRVKNLASSPESHNSFGGCSMMWKTTKKMIPKGLDETQFERWLFRMQ